MRSALHFSTFSSSTQIVIFLATEEVFLVGVIGPGEWVTFNSSMISSVSGSLVINKCSGS